jgi:hypothetical protein
MEKELTPKEQAIKMVERYEEIEIVIGYGIPRAEAVKCALLQTDALLDEVSPQWWGSETDKAYTRYKHYEQIKEELLKL